MLTFALFSLLLRPWPLVSTTDITHFWKAYDSVVTVTDTVAQDSFIQRLYLDQGSAGLKDISAIRHWTAARIRMSIDAHPAFWSSIRGKTLAIPEEAPRIRELMQRYRKLYPSFREPEVYFVIGYLGTGGTTTQTRVLIGSEIASGDSTVDAEGLNPVLQKFYKTNRGIPYLVAHELTHTQQQGGDMEDRRATNLLGFCLAEGMCDFMAERLLEKPLTQPYITYGLQHDRELWTLFKTQMHGRDISGWLYNMGSSVAVSDLGYYMGYAICKSYYERSADKQQALHDILTLPLEDTAFLDDFIRRSGYDHP
ncbi:DUF2268 domain-containing putative Zn-dependent protease [Dinghuibacter silviterrae]|uniref:Putative Zn-dependent protease DUF2268 n=1 Tax=Dinghuibacter silviterrae TaxID=1539049 RepID=A0A4R8DXP6_9BACT|nr:DUF2268 domain-containing putative Zn-dependent protease [Dinghuibacter silviterrae]TDX02325.1 putative Zn-dependent protease DUF2268 [Dinghuibacter silviterrae]